MNFFVLKVFPYCLMFCILVLSGMNCQAFVQLHESIPLFESLTRAKALGRLHNHRPEPVYAQFHTSSGVSNNLSAERLLDFGIMIYSFVRARYAPDRYSPEHKLAPDSYQLELLSETGNSGHFLQEWLVREVPNSSPGVKTSSDQSHSGSRSSTTGATAVVTLSGSGAVGGTGSQGSGDGGDGDGELDRTNYARLADIPDKNERVLALLNCLTIEVSGEQSGKSAIQMLERRCAELERSVQKLLEGEASGSATAETPFIKKVKEALAKITSQSATNSALVASFDDRLRTLDDRCQERESLLRTGTSNRHNQLDARITNLEARIANLEGLPQQSVVWERSGVLLWRIEGFQRIRNAAIGGVETAIFSQPFYTAPYGYKCRAKMYPNGDGFGRGSHLSLFFIVMKGDYDSLQSWPFLKKITMMLLEQGNGNHIIDAFHSDPQSSSFRRPTSESNVASGSPLFMPIDSLPNGQFVKDDVMFIKIIVD